MTGGSSDGSNGRLSYVACCEPVVFRMFRLALFFTVGISVLHCWLGACRNVCPVEIEWWHIYMVYWLSLSDARYKWWSGWC